MATDAIRLVLDYREGNGLLIGRRRRARVRMISIAA
jgi:hypothetical protein